MNRRKFLVELQRMWLENAEMDIPLTIADLLDDAGTLGLLGATGLYMRVIRDMRSKV